MNIEAITPPTSPPPATVGATPPRPADKGKKVQEGASVVAPTLPTGVVVQESGRREGKDGHETDWEGSSEAGTDQGVRYTRRFPQGPTATGASGHSGSLLSHNPACDDLPHAPRWSLTQGSRMDSLDNCRSFYTLCMPPAERLFQKKRSRFELLDDHIHSGVNFFSTTQEIAREWRSMGEDLLEFENEKRAFAEESEKYNREERVAVEGC